jgi:hypothetical protein
MYETRIVDSAPSQPEKPDQEMMYGIDDLLGLLDGFPLIFLTVEASSS